jgi:hypothetical protein
MDDVAPDGSPVAFYRRLPSTGEPEPIQAALCGVLDGAGLALVGWLERPGWFVARGRAGRPITPEPGGSR